MEAEKDIANKQLDIKKIYVKDVSFESPKAPDALDEKWQPHLDIQLRSSSTKLSDEDFYEVTLHMTITARKDQETIFLVDVTQAGTFEFTNVDKKETDAALQIHCPNILFPFARETIAGLITKGGFPQLLLGPINFEAIYKQKLQALHSQDSEHSKPH